MASNHPTADAVRAELARARKTQSDAARRLGVRQSAISRRLRGEVDFTVGEIFSLARWLNVPVTRLLGDPDGAGRLDESGAA